MELPAGFSWARNVELGSPEVYRLSQEAWPGFLVGESDIPEPTLKFQISLRDFQERFRAFGIRETATGTLIAFIQAVQVKIDLSARDLPDDGYRFSIHDAAIRSPKNCLSLVEASVDPRFRGRGLSRHLISRAKREARAMGFTTMIAPVRPTLKSQSPDVPFADHCRRKRADGRLFDPWLRAHVESGAVIQNICNNSVRVRATLAKWREWTGLDLVTPGSQDLSGALAPMMVDLDAGIGTYVEANVWVRYELNGIE
jgi:GNAT superfamily N-acetyltransferase